MIEGRARSFVARPSPSSPPPCLVQAVFATAFDSAVIDVAFLLAQFTLFTIVIHSSIPLHFHCTRTSSWRMAGRLVGCCTYIGIIGTSGFRIIIELCAFECGTFHYLWSACSSKCLFSAVDGESMRTLCKHASQRLYHIEHISTARSCLLISIVYTLLQAHRTPQFLQTHTHTQTNLIQFG